MVRTFPALPLLFVTAIWGGWLQSPTVADSRDQRQLDGSRGLKRGVYAQGNRVSYGHFAVDKFHRLQVSVGSSSLVSNYRECALSCVNNPPCSSFNVASSPRSDGKYQCELLNEDKYSANPGQLVSSQKYHHYSIKTPCSSFPCKNGAKCVPNYGENQYYCDCVPGYTGKYCETDIDECAAPVDPCDAVANSVCNNSNGSYICQCNDGFVKNGSVCEDIDECVTAAEQKCDANADCVNTHGSYNCSCKSGYTGDGLNCSDIDECAKPTPVCGVNAVCNNNLGAYNCTCKPGYSGDGQNCTDIDECASNPCQNNGSCSDGVNGYNCSCVAGFTGEKCETDIDDCASNLCQNQGTCIDGVNGYTCSCKAGYTGAHCETDIDECASNPCKNNGSCTDGVNGYNCSCVAGFTGKNCETDIDDCASNPCQNQGSCIDGVNGYTCNCKAGYTGTYCETADVCQNYQTLSDAGRKETYETVSYQCDYNLNGWYRFQGAAGTRMATSCPSEERCDTTSPGWLDGAHPTVAEGTVTRKVCFHMLGSCCSMKSFIQVKNCGSYYIYSLVPTPQCNMRYCGTD
ncbi:hypothetical protein ACROYT_G032486 [Oculina patagonica]